jgi:hypothetical protein
LIYFCFNTVYNIGSNLRSLTSKAIWIVTRLWWAINHAQCTSYSLIILWEQIFARQSNTST